MAYRLSQSESGRQGTQENRADGLLGMGMGQSPQPLLYGFAVCPVEVVHGPAEETGKGGGGELVGLLLQAGEDGTAPVLCGYQAGEVVLLEVHQSGEAGGAVLYFRPMAEQPPCGFPWQDEPAVSPAVGVGQDVTRSGKSGA